MVKLTDIHLGYSPNYINVEISVDGYLVDSIENTDFLSIDQTSYLTFKVNANEQQEGADPKQFTLNHTIDKTMVFSTVESDNYKYTLISYETEDLPNLGFKVSFNLKKEKTSYCENINPVDPFLMFYRKFLPYSRYRIYGAYKDEFYDLGDISRITYDTELQKYKLYSSEGVVIYYDRLPLVNPSKVDVAGTQYTNPPTLVWLIDTQDLNDLMFIDTIKPKSIQVNDSRYSDFSDWCKDFASGNFNLQKISIEARSINKRIVVDLSTYTTLDYKEFISYISYDMIKIFKIPFKQVYFKLKDQFTLTRLIIEYDDQYSIQVDGNFIYHTTAQN